MDLLQIELAKLQKDANLKHSIEDVDKLIAQLEAARASIAAGKFPRILCRMLLTSSDPKTASLTLAKLQNPIKQGFDKVNDDLKKVYSGQAKYGKALDRDKVRRRHVLQDHC